MIKTTGKEKNYELIEYVNDVNREHTCAWVLSFFHSNNKYLYKSKSF